MTELLDRLARNYRWVWDEPTQELFRAVDPAMWDDTKDPFAVLRSGQIPTDPAFADRVRAADEDLTAYLAGDLSGSQPGARGAEPYGPRQPEAAYFCMEYGIAPPLRTYAGGLGMLAGDIVKTASDLRVPIVAIGLLYGQWFRQRLDYGWQQEDWQRFDPTSAGLEECTRFELPLAGEPVPVRVWRARVGRVDLYLLDAGEVTDRLYMGDAEHRLRQELVLGIGGVRALAALDIRPTVFHANEGHAGFMCLERVERLVEQGQPYDRAVEAVRAGTVFTTHTPVPAGFDLFDRGLIERYLGGWCGRSTDDLMALGHFPGQHPQEPFNMAVLCGRMAGTVTAVSRLHREITEQRVLGPLWPGRAAPVRAVTNGVHPGTWTPPELSSLFRRYVGPGWEYADPESWERVWQVPAAELWQLRQRLRARMVEAIRAYLPRALRETGWSAELEWASAVLDPSALTIVVARRAAEYKETDLLVSMPERLKALTLDSQRPVCLIVSGLAHPADNGGKERIRRIVELSLWEDMRAHVVYLPGYDMRLAQLLLAGADVWLNHPRRGEEACGTSFMKSVYCGGRVVTTADGGADEMIVDGDNGWIIGDRTFGASREAMADQAFDLLQRSVVPEFYDRDDSGMPARWIAGIKRSLATLAPQASSVHMVRTYARLYRDAARTMS
jgi:starch phosphorylase